MDNGWEPQALDPAQPTKHPLPVQSPGINVKLTRCGCGAISSRYLSLIWFYPDGLADKTRAGTEQGYIVLSHA